MIRTRRANTRKEPKNVDSELVGTHHRRGRLKTTLRKRLAVILRHVEVLDLYRCRLESVFQVNAVGDLDCRVEKR